MVAEDPMAFPRGGRHSSKNNKAATNATTTESSSDKKKTRDSKRSRKDLKQNNEKSELSSSSIKTDFLFGSKEDSKDEDAQKNKKRKVSATTSTTTPSSSSHSLLPLGGGGVIVSTGKSSNSHNKKDSATTTTKDGTTNTSTSILIEAFGFSKLAKGTKALGIIREVQDEYAIVSLPNMLSAYILPPSSNNNNKDGNNNNNNNNNYQNQSLKRCLSVGQVLAVVVQKVVSEPVKKTSNGTVGGNQPRRRIQVSPLPSIVNGRDDDYWMKTTQSKNNRLPIRGQIISIEDHGCLVDLGFGRKGFCKFDDIEGGNYKILEDDEDDEDDDGNNDNEMEKDNNGDEQEEDENDENEEHEEGEGKKKKKKHKKKKSSEVRILQPGRLYDFFATPSAATSDSQQQKLQQVYTLTLPTVTTLSKQTVAPPVLNAGGGRGGNHSKFASSSTPFTLNSLCPGWLVNAKVEALAKNGLCVTFLNNVFRGSIELSHLGANFIPKIREANNGAWKEIFDKHQHFQARILAVDVPTKMIRLSLAPHLLELDTKPTSIFATTTKEGGEGGGFPPVGSIVKGCTVIRQDPLIGALLALPEEYNRDLESLSKRIKKSDLFKNPNYAESTKARTVYVHISKALEEKDTSGAIFSKEFAPSTVHDVRILGIGNLMDGVATGACAPSILNAHVLTHSDLKPGQLYKQVPVCAQLDGGSVLVQLGGSFKNTTDVRALIPPMHLFDTSNNNSNSEFRRKLMKEKFAVDAKIDVRVLWVDSEKKKCVVTAKKSLVKADDSEIISSYEDLKLGMQAMGFISRIDEKNMYITFFNQVFGRVTARSLAAELGIEDHTESYKVGDVVKCRVVKLKNRKRRSRSRSRSFGNEMDVDSDNEDDDHNNNSKSISRGESFCDVALSLKVDDIDNDESMNVDNPKQIRVKAGAILPMKSMKIVELQNSRLKKDGGFIPGCAIVSIKSKHVVDDSQRSSVVQNIECKLPYDQLLDEYDPKDIESAEAFDRLADQLLTVGKKINQKGLILTDPHKSNVDYSTGIGKLPVVSIRKNLIETAEKQYAAVTAGKEITPEDIIVPDPDSNLFVGALVQGYVAQVDPRHGAFIRFLDGMTGLLPKKLGGADIPPYETVVTKIKEIDDRQRPFKILLETTRSSSSSTSRSILKSAPMHPGDKIDSAKVTKIHFNEIELSLPASTTPKKSKKKIRVVMDGTMKECSDVKIKYNKKSSSSTTTNNEVESRSILKGHPFYRLEVGQELSNLTVVAVRQKKEKFNIYVTDKPYVVNEDSEKKTNNDDDDAKQAMPPTFIENMSDVQPGMVVTAFVNGIVGNNRGIHVRISPFVSAFIPGLEVSKDLRVLNNLKQSIVIGSRIRCRVMDRGQWNKVRGQCPFASRQHHHHDDNDGNDNDNKNNNAKEKDLTEKLFLSVLACEEEGEGKNDTSAPKPKHGELLIGCVQKSLPQTLAPALMIAFRGGYVGRCCITEIAENDDWENMPIGTLPTHHHPKKDAEEGEEKKEDEGKKKRRNSKKGKEKKEATTDMDVDKEEEEDDDSDDSDNENEDEEDGNDESEIMKGVFPDGTYVECRVLKTFPKQSLVDVSLRKSRIEGDLEEDPVPEVGETVQGYVVQTNKKGCFVRIARHVEGRVTLKEICDGFLKDPEKSFPPGRLVVGRVKEVHNAVKKSKHSHDPVKIRLDLDMRESTLLQDKKKLEFDDVEVNQKYKGTVTRIESYGVFVQLENSNISGLVHLSECSDKFIKNLQALYDPGDLVKVLVVKKDPENKKLGFSMKASHFENDEDSDDSSVGSAQDNDDDDDSDDEKMVDVASDDDKDSDEELDSDDENFASKLASKMKKGDKDGDDDDSSSSSSDDDGKESKSGDSDSDDGSGDSSDDDSEDDDDDEKKGAKALDTDVGFEWGAGTSGKESSSSGGKKKKNEDSDDDSSDDDEDDEDGDGGEKSSSHKSRKKQAQRRKEEKEISRRETALADGTADENPETAGDFERLLAGNPNSSELWIKYMAFHLSLSDVPAARAVADKAMERIEFRQEREKLNVWTALLTLEHKYGDHKSFLAAIDRACGQNNPKQVYLRACEILEKDDSSSSPDAIARADSMYSKMCKKFKSKKTVWLAHLQYLLKQQRHQEAHALLKRGLLSLPSYKHAETMSKFAQLEFEYGSVERARTVFDGIVEKYPKRLDLFFVYVDKEIKHGSIDTARALLEKKVEGRSLSDKKMKNLFKKWYRIEEEHGTEETQEKVKESARAYVENSN